MMSHHWAIISGTNRAASNTRKVAGHIESLLKSKIQTDEKIEMIDLTELPQDIFTPQAYAEKPASFQRFVDQILNAKALICILPEYNGSAPGAFKYFIDMLPFPQSLQKVPTAYVGLAAGRFGALRAIEQIQQVFTYRNAFNYPESLYIMDAANSLSEKGAPKDPFVQKLLDDTLDGFIDFANRLSR